MAEWESAGNEVDEKDHLPTVGFISEYDALPEIGHACGHNLIATTGVTSALTFTHVLSNHPSTPRFRAILFGTPAEETIGGKIKMIKEGAFKDVDCVLMAHPGGRDAWHAQWLALETLEVEFFGKSSHAGGAPWEGVNALDAAVMAYNSISSLRQQIQPSCRVHGIIRNGGAAPNIIPDYTKMEYYIRTPVLPLLRTLTNRVEGCFHGAAQATGCTVKIAKPPTIADVKTNNLLMTRFEQMMLKVNGLPQDPNGKGKWVEDRLGADVLAGSTDMGNVTRAVPGIHPMYSIYRTISVENANIHTHQFREQAGTDEAFNCAMNAAKALALVGVDVVLDSSFREGIREEFANSFV